MKSYHFLLFQLPGNLLKTQKKCAPYFRGNTQFPIYFNCTSVIKNRRRRKRKKQNTEKKQKKKEQKMHDYTQRAPAALALACVTGDA
jgi:hypothetical protein